MAIQIIKQGVDPNDKFCGMCHACGAILEYEYGDLESPISSWHELHLICPVCGRALAFNPDAIKEHSIEIKRDSLLISFDGTVEVPNGCQAYVLTHQGNEIHLTEVTDFIPDNTAVLIIGSGTVTFRYFPGVFIDKPTNALTLAVAAEDNATAYYINGNKELELRNDFHEGEQLISTFDANELTKLVED